MIYIGESINSSIKRIRKAVEENDGDYIKRLAKAQKNAGADYLDVNCGTRVEDEVQKMEWLVNLVQEEVKLPLCIDTPSYEALEKGLSLCKYGQPIINSITAEEERFAKVLPLIKKYYTKVVALLMDDNGMPKSAEDRIRIANKLVPDLLNNGVAPENIILDPIVKPIGTGDTAGLEVFEAIRSIKESFPDINFSVGLSNISHGLPVDREVNHTFLVMCIANGLNYCIVNVLDKEIIGYATVAEALLGMDKYCSKLLKKYRKGYFSEKVEYLDL